MATNIVTQAQVDEILSKAEKIVQHRVFGKCTVIMVKLPNGFVIVESTGCVDPANYNEAVGETCCMERIRAKVWAMEGYVLANRVAGIDPEREARLAARRDKRRQKALRKVTNIKYDPCCDGGDTVKIESSPGSPNVVDYTLCPGGTDRTTKEDNQ